MKTPIERCRPLAIAWMLAALTLGPAAAAAAEAPAGAISAAGTAGPGTGPAVPAVEAADDAAEFAAPPVADPLEKFNRVMFGFNDRAYGYVLRPLARGYEEAVPGVLRRGLGHFFENVRFPVRFASAVLQGRGRRAARETGRFVVNTVAGVGGFIRISDRIPALAPEPDLDLGQTFGRWGIGPGAYLVLPLLGPGDLRDFAGEVGDYVLTPTHWRFAHYHDWRLRLGVQTADTLSALPATVRLYYDLKSAALDPYLAMREAYLAHRAAAIKP